MKERGSHGLFFFNNIITSNLNLRTQSGTSLGRNSQALSGELDNLENQVAGNLFQNLRTSLPAASSGGQTHNPSGGESITDITFLDQFLGGPAPQQSGAQGRGHWLRQFKSWNVESGWKWI